MDTNDLILRAANMATKAALSGNPIIGIWWVPPQSGSDGPEGLWVVKHLDRQLGGSETPPWETK